MEKVIFLLKIRFFKSALIRKIMNLRYCTIHSFVGNVWIYWCWENKQYLVTGSKVIEKNQYMHFCCQERTKSHRELKLSGLLYKGTGHLLWKYELQGSTSSGHKSPSKKSKMLKFLISSIEKIFFQKCF
jgi:hypothetical protein